MSKSLIVERDVEMKTRDGVILRADVYRPGQAGNYPVILQRTPYGKGFSQIPLALMAADRGYAVVIQDTRGRWASEGDSYPFINEKNDGYDAVEWAGNQPWANGKVGMFGSSYVGYTQLASAVMHPPSLKTITPTITFSDLSRLAYVNGALALGAMVSWGYLAGAMMAVMRHPGNDLEKALLMGQLISAVDGMSLGNTMNTIPIKDMPLIGDSDLTPYFRDGLTHPPGDEYWQRGLCKHEDIQIPALHIGGWYDLFIDSTLKDFTGIQQKGNPSQKLIIGPWVHGAFDGLNGEVDFGLQASALLLLPDEILLRWFDHWLKEIPNGIMEEPPIQIFVMGTNQWRSEYEWPLARTRYTPFYLHSGGGANTLNGDGSLSQEKPSVEPIDNFAYDPLNPVPTRGGALCCWEVALPAGAYDQRSVEERPDVLVYTTPPLEQDLEVTGAIQVHLWASTTAVDTDFTAKLVDVGPCKGGGCTGYARNVQDGIIRTRYRNPGEVALLKPGKIYEFIIDLAATSNVFKAGHRIRIEISSSNFPRFDRNPNTGASTSDTSELRPALQTIYHDAEHPSHILLPVIPG